MIITIAFYKNKIKARMKTSTGREAHKRKNKAYWKWTKNIYFDKYMYLILI